ncbi:hypothetical protein [Nitratireductor sp. L15S-10]|uniref:hypothetical protein n=1 Tax=Nitratireductor sp. L15S-10 TaxID=3034028 RepID=UPI003857F228
MNYFPQSPCSLTDVPYSSDCGIVSQSEIWVVTLTMLSWRSSTAMHQRQETAYTRQTLHLPGHLSSISEYQNFTNMMRLRPFTRLTIELFKGVRQPHALGCSMH